MHTRRTGARHETQRTAGVRSEDYWEFAPDTHVMTTDGYAGRVIAVHDGPFPGAEDYEVKLDGGMGGGLYRAGQLQALAEGEHTAAADYPELSDPLTEHPDPAKMVTYASLTKTAAMPGQGELFPEPEHVTPKPSPKEEWHDRLLTKAFGEPCPKCGVRENHPDHDAVHEQWHEENADECPQCGGDRNDPEEHSEEHQNWLGEQNWYTDWDAEQPKDTLHRGMSMSLPDHVHDVVHDESRPMHERADALLKHVLDQNTSHGHIGPYWSDNPTVSRDYAERTQVSPYGRKGHNGQTPVMLHVHFPGMQHIETDPDELEHLGVYSYHLGDNREVPLQHGAPLKIKGISWGQPTRYASTKNKKITDDDDEFYNDPEWTHHEFGEHEGHQALAARHLSTTINGVEIDEHGSAPHKVRAYDPAAYDRESTEGEPDPGDVAAEKKTSDYMHSHGSLDDQLRQVLGHTPSMADLRIMAASEPDDDQDEVDEDGLCAYPHDGPCPEPDEPQGIRHQAMPSRRYPDHPEGFHSEITQYRPGGESRITGYHGNGRTMGTIDYHAFDEDGNVVHDNAAHPEDVHAIKVNMLHGYGHGGASAVMDHLYNKHPNAWINHGFRTNEGLRWWRSYDEPDPDRNVHNVPPHHWSHAFDPADVASDIRRNEANDPGHHSDDHDVEWTGYGDDEPYCEHCEDYTDHSTRQHEEMYDKDEDEDEDEPEEEEHDPDPRDMPLSHGMAVHLSPNDHAFVHNPEIPSEHRARRLLEAIGRGNMPTDRWHDDKGPALSDSYNAAAKLQKQSPHSRVPPTQVTLHAAPFKHEEVHAEDDYGDDAPQFTSSPEHRRVDFHPIDKPINFHLYGMNWSTHGGAGLVGSNYGIHHFRDQHEPVGMQMAQYEPMHLRDNYLRGEDYAEREQIRQEHEQRYAPHHSPLNPPGTGEQQKLFAKRAHVVLPEPGSGWEGDDRIPEHLVAEHGWDPEDVWAGGRTGDRSALLAQHDIEHEHPDERKAPFPVDHSHGSWYRRPDMPEDTSAATSPIWGGADFGPYEHGSTEPMKLEYHPAPAHLSSFDPYTMIRDAALDEDFKFHVTAAWRDVRAKAKRIRAEGKVRITLASEGMVIGEVQGDHHVYESGIQRLPGSRQAVATYSCGCKWGAYHWGAADDFSRFAGRMCSHALALQFEAQSRGMFGRDVLPDTEKPKWVPNRVVVKYDIDDDRNQFARASAIDISPLQVFLKTAQDDGIPLLLRTAGIDTRYLESGSIGREAVDTHRSIAGAPHEAAVSNPFGERMVDVPPKPYGATSPRDPYQSPASSGFLSSPDPDDWASIDPNSYLTHQGSRQQDEAVFEPVTGTMAQDAYMNPDSPSDPNGAQATLHDEPEPALPSTDGDLYGADEEALSPESPSIQTIGTAEAVADGGGGSDGAIGGDDEIGDIVEGFQNTAAAQALRSGGGSGEGRSDGDIAAQARRVLAMKAFTPLEQQELIREGERERASNLDRLELTGTHYIDDEDEEPWLS